MAIKRRKVLLIEPKYRNKYPPIGLMKIATYHRLLGDNVQFYKGDLKDLVLDELTWKCIRKLRRIDKSRDWKQSFYELRQYIKTRKKSDLAEMNLETSQYPALLQKVFMHLHILIIRKSIKNTLNGIESMLRHYLLFIGRSQLKP